MKKAVILLSLLLMASISFAESRIRMASTTSTENSGLFGYLLPIFEKLSGITIDAVAVGTGAAIEIGKRGDADVVFVHAREQELKAVEEGFFVNRHDVMYNDFVIIGPPADPAKVAHRKKALDVFRAIASTKSAFVSRGDKSGTHTKELALWKAAGIDPTGKSWYREAGQGMEKTQRIADELQAYTMSDRGTWLSVKDRNKLELLLLFEGDPPLFNQYGVMAVNPEKNGNVKYKEAMRFVDWIVSKEGQAAIAAFKDKSGNALFIPNAK